MKKQQNPEQDSRTARPPRWADRLLEWFVAPHLLEYVQGDLHENFYKQTEQFGLKRARRDYMWAVLHCLTPFFFKRREPEAFFSYYKKKLTNDMLPNYLTIAFRNLLRHKAFTAINISGLAAGLASCLLIFLFMADELSYDRYYVNAERIYRMTLHTRFGEKDINYAYTSEPAGQTLLRDCPGIETVTRLRDDGGMLVKNGHDVFKEERIAFVDSNFFSFFSIPMLKGNKANALIVPKTLVLTETTARKYFGDADPIGKTLSIGNLGLFQITGVCADIPSNTHFHHDMFGSFKSVNQGTKWLASGAYVYLQLRTGYSIRQIEAQSRGFITKYVAPEVKEFLGISLSEFLQKGNRMSFGFQPVTDIHLHSDLSDELEANGDVQYVYIFSGIAFFILLLACINFMNLSTAGSTGRSKEVGIRKVLGSVQKQLVSQFLVESILLTALSMVLAIGLVIILLPYFNELTGKRFSLMTITDWRLLSGMVLACLVIGLLAGSYPAFVLSSFKPITVLKGRVQGSLRSGRLRNILVTGQFVVSIGIIIATLIANQQLQYIQNKKVGFNKDQVLVLHDTQVLGTQMNAFKNELSRLSSVKKITLAGFLPAGVSQQSQDGIQFRDGTRTGTHLSKSYFIDEDYLPTLGISIAQGRNFSKALASDNSAVLLNESAVKAYGFRQPIGQQISITGDGNESSKKMFTVIGVVKDFHFESMHHRIAPLVMFYGGDNSQMALRINTDDIPYLLDKIERLWKAETDNPFVYSFLSERFNTIYKSEQRIGQIFGIFAGLAILISCLGLFGLAAFTTQQRTKEIGIRKVLGASVINIVGLLLKNFLMLILIAIIIAVPLAGYGMNQWLKDFAYRIDVQWWIFVLAGGLIISIAILTVSYQTLKAAMVNPVKSLKSE